MLFEEVEQPIIEWALDYGITPAIIIGRLMKIADELGTSPNWLLGVSLASATDPEFAALTDRFANAANGMSKQEIEMALFRQRQ
ncbi:hypothetical protein LJR235_005368 [Pararhizobium sp. LjRoot235]|uniref:hypothetical protein n=1 Tax=Pararhizobium sp. LjRoot235 TaxID=3342291 RepID=UPI003ECE0160